MAGRLVERWVQGGALAGLLLLFLLPVLAGFWPAWLTATFLSLPLYMLHQLEEHDADRFRRFVNATVGKGGEALTTRAVFVINVPGVWGVIGAAVYLARYVRPGLGLIAVHLLLVNALVHVAGGILLRRYNPGLISAVLLFVPAGLWSIGVLDDAGAGVADHAIGVAVALVIHAAIVAHVRRRARIRRGPRLTAHTPAA